MEALIAVGLGVAAFVTTNADNLLLLLAFLSDPSYRPRQVISGYCLAMLALLLLAIGGAAVGHLLPTEYLGLLGIVPLLLGVRGLIDLFRKPADAKDEPHPPIIRESNVMTVALLELGNGADTIAVFAPLLAESKLSAAIAIVTSFVVLTVVWCVAALYIWHQPKVGRYIRQYARYVVPFALIGLGVYILVDSVTDLVENMQPNA